MNLKLTDIVTDEELQARDQISDEAVADYYNFLREGGKLPPVTVFFDGTRYFLADGWHRYFAHKSAGMATIEVEVIKGTKRDAMKYAMGANDKHGLRRTVADKRKAVTMAFDDIELAELSDREIAKLCNVTHPFVAKMRKEAGAVVEEKPIKEKIDENKIPQAAQGTDEEFRLQELSDALVQANEEKVALEDRLALKVIDATEEEKARLSETLADLRQQLKVLEAENRSLKASLKVEVEEKNQLIRQVNYWKKQATKGTK
jgi:ParB-like chromosome segregation protein Spo0J